MKIYQDECPYFVTTVTADRLPVFRSLHQATILADMIKNACLMHGFSLVAFAILPDHVHLLVWPCGLENPHSPGVGQCGLSRPHEQRIISKLMKSIKGNYSRYIHQGSVWQRGYYDWVIDREDRLTNIIYYIQYNFEKHQLPQYFGQWPYVFIDSDTLS